MTRDETKRLLKEVACLFPRFAVEGEDKTLKVDLWTEALSHYEYKDIHQSLIDYSNDQNGGFAPTTGQLIELIDDRVDYLHPEGSLNLGW